MKATEVLMSEHRVIEQVLNVLEAMAYRANSEQQLDAEDAKNTIEFFRNFADKCHHGKEEVHLFTWMEAHGFPRDSGPTGVMLYEHEQGRHYIKGMDEAIEKAAQGDAEAVNQFVQNARGYIPMLREHINKEDHCLFPMADQAMKADDQKDMMDRFEKTEHEDMGSGAHEKWLEIANTLAQKYGVPLAEVNKEALTCHCHHNS